jgi:SAM-dependent methyltransferase
VADAKKLPFKDNSVDLIFSQTFLEHPLNPEDVLSEMARVLKPGGIVVHNDAWVVRWWHRFGIVELKPFAKMSVKEKLIVIASKFTELPIVRIPPIILRRVSRNLFVSTKKPIGLKYKKLKPNYNLHLGCDEDAANSIDPIDVVRFYESRGFRLNKSLSFKERMFYPNKMIELVKKK